MRILPLICVGLCVAVLPAQGGRGRDRGADPKLEHLTYQEARFQSPALGREVTYGIYLPKSYGDAANKERRYPFVLWLHGMFENHSRFHRRGGAQILEAQVANGKLPEFALVAVNGDLSFYINGKESGRYEDMVVQDLLAHLRKEYRLRDDRDGCAIMGVSMGGMGALNIAFHHPEKFGTVATHSAALFPPDVENLPPQFRRRLESNFGRQLQLSKIFGNPPDPELWRKNNPLHHAATLPVETLKTLRIYFDCARDDEYGFGEPNQELHEILEKRKVPHGFLLPDGSAHGWDYNPRVMPDSLKFVTQGWSDAKPASRPASQPAGGGDGMERSK